MDHGPQWIGPGLPQAPENVITRWNNSVAFVFVCTRHIWKLMRELSLEKGRL
jgi:hypothetical protein